MIFFYGLYHWFRRQLVSDRACCGVCGQDNRPLRSYSAWEITHFMFIPLIPWGRVRVVCYCLTCRHCYRFSLKGRRLKGEIDDHRKEAFARVGQDVNQTLNDVAHLAHLGDFEGVRSLLDKLDGKGRGIRVLAEARFLALQGHDKEAEASFRKAVDADPSSGTPDFWLGRFLLARERDEEAIEQFQRAAQLNPGYEYFGVLQDFSRARKQRKNWRGLAVIMGEMVRLRPSMTEDRKFGRLYVKACRKSGRVPETANPYADV